MYIVGVRCASLRQGRSGRVQQSHLRKMRNNLRKCRESLEEKERRRSYGLVGACKVVSSATSAARNGRSSTSDRDLLVPLQLLLPRPAPAPRRDTRLQQVSRKARACPITKLPSAAASSSGACKHLFHRDLRGDFLTEEHWQEFEVCLPSAGWTCTSAG